MSVWRIFSMKDRNLTILFLSITTIALLFCYSGCKKKDHDYYFPPAEEQLPPTRTFYMGVTPWPHAYTLEAINEVYENIENHTDMIAHHFDDGVPWPEAHDSLSYHANVESQLSERTSRLQPGQKVYLAICPLGSDRCGLAGYWGEESDMERPGVWLNRNFDDPEVITSYINFCNDLISRFNPDYFNYGVEVNEGWTDVSEPDFQKFLTFLNQVYTSIKNDNPDLPVFVSITRHFSELTQAQLDIYTAVLQYSDYVAVSTYPFLAAPTISSNIADPEYLPSDWFSSIAALAPAKPFAIAETAYIAETLSIPEYGLNIKGTSPYQADYVRFLFNEMNNLNGEFAVWFVMRDYDQLWAYLEDAGMAPPIMKVWKDCGLINGGGGHRESMKVWDAWLGLPKN
jgi:hypothetical protein